MAVESLDVTNPFVNEYLIKQKDPLMDLADYSLELVRALRSMEQNPGNFEPAELKRIKDDLWRVLDEVTVTLVNASLAEPLYDFLLPSEVEPVPKLMNNLEFDN